MRLTVTAFLFVAGLLFLPAAKLTAQSPAEDSALYHTAINNAISLYHQAAGDQSGLFNGSQYASFPFTFEEEAHPFFYSGKPGKGAVVYDGVLYQNLLLQYDEVQGVLVMQDDKHRIQLLNPRLSNFTVFDNRFIRLVKDSTDRALPGTGFYNLLYSGETSLLKKEEKSIRTDVSRGELQRFIDVRTWYFIKKSNDYYAVRTKKNLFEIFADRKKEIRQYIKANRLNYRKDRQSTLEKATAYYDQLTK